MNKTKIDWADYSWNPITGCLHDCEYCYARKIANRFGKEMPDFSIYPKLHKGCHMVENKFIDNPYPFLFEPTFHKYRLDEPSIKTKGVTIFVCSMADLFGEWVPDEWMNEVFEACKKAPQHRYLFLTKNPGRYMELAKKGILPSGNNFWYGTTVNTEEDYFFYSPEYFTFVSIEPILAKFDSIDDHNWRGLTDWIIVGAETGNRKDKLIPKKDWIMDIKKQCKDSGIPLFLKESLRGIMGQDFIQEFPWEED